jgi:hypothetical protein
VLLRVFELLNWEGSACAAGWRASRPPLPARCECDRERRTSKTFYVSAQSGARPPNFHLLMSTTRRIRTRATPTPSRGPGPQPPSVDLLRSPHSLPRPSTLHRLQGHATQPWLRAARSRGRNASMGSAPGFRNWPRDTSSQTGRAAALDRRSVTLPDLQIEEMQVRPMRR